ncbi:hypothetical protein [Streptomyces sp. NPDC056628]|uniref:hypothetical protein n=1 Tax=Streptomyces sp. NPDC056628 TaxID=3345882 RepID=UPI0036C0E488
MDERKELARQLLDEMFDRWNERIGPPVDRAILEKWQPADANMRDRLLGGDCLEHLAPLVDAWDAALDARAALIGADEDTVDSAIGWGTKAAQVMGVFDDFSAAGLAEAAGDVYDQRRSEQKAWAALSDAERKWRRSARQLQRARQAIRTCLTTGWKGEISLMELSRKDIPHPKPTDRTVSGRTRLVWDLRADGQGSSGPLVPAAKRTNESASLRFNVAGGYASHSIQYDLKVESPDCLLEETHINTKGTTSQFFIQVELRCTDQGACTIVLPRQHFVVFMTEKGSVSRRLSCDAQPTKRTVDTFYSYKWHIPETVIGNVAINKNTLRLEPPVGVVKVTRRRTDSEPGQASGAPTEIPIQEITSEMRVRLYLRRGPD